MPSTSGNSHWGPGARASRASVVSSGASSNSATATKPSDRFPVTHLLRGLRDQGKHVLLEGLTVLSGRHGQSSVHIRRHVADENVRHACTMQACRTLGNAHADAKASSGSSASSSSSISSARPAAAMTSATTRSSFSATDALFTRVNSAVPRERSGPTANASTSW